MCIYIYIYIYIPGERGRRELPPLLGAGAPARRAPPEVTYVCMYVYVYMYIYIYIHTYYIYT